jgi:hypothetical protein
MAERAALVVASFALVGACMGLLMRLDRSLLVIRYQFSLLTLLIVLGVLPPLGAVGYWTWKTHKPPRSRWYGGDAAPTSRPLREGYRPKLTSNDLIKVSDGRRE